LSYFSKKFIYYKIFSSWNLTQKDNNWFYHRFIEVSTKINPIVATMKLFFLTDSMLICCDLPVYLTDCNEAKQNANEYEIKRKCVTLYRINSYNYLANEITKINYYIESVSISNNDEIDICKLINILKRKVKENQLLIGESNIKLDILNHISAILLNPWYNIDEYVITKNIECDRE